MSHRIVAAIDTHDLNHAEDLVKAVAPHVGAIKIGMEFFLIWGTFGYNVLEGYGKPIILDLKFKDIPSTVKAAVSSVGILCPMALTIHADGGHAMIRAAREEVENLEGRVITARPMILAVTVLTSITEFDMAALGMPRDLNDHVLRLGRMAMTAGADGLVCSPHEVATLRQSLPQAKLLVPGVRPSGSSGDDQARVATPAQAVADGADWIVIGRPITQAADPGQAAAEISATLKEDTSETECP